MGRWGRLPEDGDFAPAVDVATVTVPAIAVVAGFVVGTLPVSPDGHTDAATADGFGKARGAAVEGTVVPVIALLAALDRAVAAHGEGSFRIRRKRPKAPSDGHPSAATEASHKAHSWDGRSSNSELGR